MRIENLLLDTCAVIWITQDQPIAREAVDVMNESAGSGASLRVSVMTAWEMGMLVSKGRLPSTKHPLRWFEEFVQAGSVEVEGVSPQILVSASYLPSPIHNDPMDRILIATARERDLRIVTRDRAILAYGAAGHVKTLAC
jgi:PIN domain nuclease of toxin-antitoxin system